MPTVSPHPKTRLILRTNQSHLNPCCVPYQYIHTYNQLFCELLQHSVCELLRKFIISFNLPVSVSEILITWSRRDTGFSIPPHYCGGRRMLECAFREVSQYICWQENGKQAMQQMRGGWQSKLRGNLRRIAKCLCKCGKEKGRSWSQITKDVDDSAFIGRSLRRSGGCLATYYRFPCFGTHYFLLLSPPFFFFFLFFFPFLAFGFLLSGFLGFLVCLCAR